jgi:hypothetical protein
VRLTIDGRVVALPERAGGSVRLGATRPVTEANQLDVQVFRKLTDSLPGTLQTRLLLRVAGEPRETVIGPLLPEGFTPMQLSGPLPARLDPDGRLRVQLRAGTWWLELAARSDSALDRVVLAKDVAPEVWSFEALDRLRSVSVEGVQPTDPRQANVPADWQALPAFRVEAGNELRLTERSRGMSGQNLNRVAVERDLWWDFDGDGYTFRDMLNGQLKQRWRLDMSPPYALQGARSGDQPLLVTAHAGHTGVEVRSPALGIEATGRVEDGARELPVTGWDEHIENIGINLHLPPGHRLLATFGVDQAPGSWLEGWRLLDMFIVLLVTAVAFRLAGIPVAALALAALVLAHQDAPILTWLTLNLLIATALARFAPAGRLQRVASIWQAASFVVVLVVFVPFALNQARLAFFPQLDGAAGSAWGIGLSNQAGQAEQAAVAYDRAVPAAEAPPALAIEAPREGPVQTEIVDEDEAAKMSSVTRADGGLAGSYRTPPPPPPSAANVASIRNAPDALLQNGPGVPGWQYRSYRLQWSGPVEPTQSMRVVVLTKLWLSLWRLAAVALVGLLLAQLAGSVFTRIRSDRLTRWFGDRRSSAAVAGLLLGCAVAILSPTPARADETPSREMLEELGRRLTRPPTCAPTCANIASAAVRVDGDTLVLNLEAHAGAAAGLRLPQVPQRWTIDSVRIDGEPARALALDGNGVLITALDRGVHRVEMRGRLVASESLRIAFPDRPATIEVTAPGWEVSGVERGRLLGDGLSLIRVRTSESQKLGELAADEFPPYVRVTRTLTFDLDWRVDVHVQRLAPAQGAFVVELPLLPGESVLSAGIPVRSGRAVVAMPAGASDVAWSSTLARAEKLELAAPEEAPWIEVWQLAVGPIWRVEASGTPEVFAAGDGGASGIRQFEPRPGESLALAISRPVGVEGATFAFERVDQRLAVGRRATDVTLQLQYRSTQGGRHVIALPAGARLQSVQADGQALALDLREGELALPLQPGTHQLDVAWQVDGGAQIATRPGLVDLRAPSSNVATHVALGEDRWILFARGGGVGPAILYWAELVVFVVIAVLLGRYAPSSLSTREWLLVGLGLSTFSWSVLILFAVWVFAMQWRGTWRGANDARAFNAVQVLLALLTVVALGSLLAAIPHGLLGQPDMRIQDPMYDYSALNWFHDRVDSELPRPLVISTSLWFYKAAMLAWALWLSFALVRWVRQAWQSYNVSGLWRRHDDEPAPAAANVSAAPLPPPADGPVA